MGQDKTRISIDHLAATKWHYIHRRYRTPFYFYILFEGSSKHYNKNIKFPYELANLLCLDSEVIFAHSDWELLRKKVEQEIIKKPNILIDVINISYSINQEISRFAASVQSRRFSAKSTSEEMVIILNKYLDYSLKFSAAMVFPLLFEEYLEREIKKELSQIFTGAAFIKAEQLFTSSIKQSSAQEEESDLLKLAIKKIEKKLKHSDILRHLAEYGWLKNVSMDGQFYSEAEIMEKINVRAKANPKKVLTLMRKNRREFLKELKFYQEKIKNNKKLSSYINTLQEAIFFRSWRTEQMYKNIVYFNNLFTEIAKRLKLKKMNDIFFLLPLEIIDLLRSNKKANQDIIEERQKGFLLFSTGQRTDVFSGAIVDQAKKKINFLESASTNNSSLSGQKAYPGKVCGIVSLITKKSDFLKMQKKNILVCRSTTPDYLPLIHKSAAIVTDEGGVLSHASIISRELRKPCIIGTKIATQILKDGDEVEVDADMGTVKILNKK